ncbi:MAG: hypothetical protein GF393_12365 [Armatimonadia bacterium]|nr:hypothetical protein [Armatimonadia bacterium]
MSGSVTGIETTATRHTALPMPDGLLVHANHYQDAELGEFEEPLDKQATENSMAREALLDGFLRERVGELTPEDLVKGLRLDEGEHPVCRAPVDDPDEITTCAAAIMCPELRKMWIAGGNPAEAPFEEVHV